MEGEVTGSELRHLLFHRDEALSWGLDWHYGVDGISWLGRTELSVGAKGWYVMGAEVGISSACVGGDRPTIELPEQGPWWGHLPGTWQGQAWVLDGGPLAPLSLSGSTLGSPPMIRDVPLGGENPSLATF